MKEQKELQWLDTNEQNKTLKEKEKRKKYVNFII
jgi:hypothetical protein